MYQTKENSGRISAKDDLANFESNFNEMKQKILKGGDRSDSTMAEQIDLLDQLASFEFGKYLIANRALNAKWTQYMVSHPQHGRITGLNSEGKRFSKCESWMLDRCPIILATQERFFNFQRILQSNVREGISMASMPCGLMDDLLGLNYYGIKDFKLTGVDIDDVAIDSAKENAVHNHLSDKCEFIQEDIWSLTHNNQFDVITSNGLNIYEPDEDRISDFYRRIHRALKSGGILVTSLLTPPPSLSEKGKSSWDAKQISQDDLRLQKVFMAYILDVRWQAAYMSEDRMVNILEEIGFKDVRVIYDRQRLFPTVIASK